MTEAQSRAPPPRPARATYPCAQRRRGSPSPPRRHRQRSLLDSGGSWEQLATLFGYRLRPELGASFDSLAVLLDATMRGLVIMALPTPELAARQVRARPFGAASEDEWTLPAIGLATIASAFLEPDPAIEWDDERITSVRQALSSLALPGM